MLHCYFQMIGQISKNTTLNVLKTVLDLTRHFKTIWKTFTNTIGEKLPLVRKSVSGV